MVSKKTGKSLSLPLRLIAKEPVSEKEDDAAETEIAADPPPEFDGRLMDEEIAQSEQSDQLKALVEQIAARAEGGGFCAPDAAADLTQAAALVMNAIDDLAFNTLAAKEASAICGDFEARLTHALVSRRKTKTSKRNPAYCNRIKALFSEKDLRLRGSPETQLAGEAWSHFSGVYQFALMAQHLKGYTLSGEEKLVLKHEKVFSLEEPLSKREANAVFAEVI